MNKGLGLGQIGLVDLEISNPTVCSLHLAILSRFGHEVGTILITWLPLLV